MKVIFLDIDGVMNSKTWYTKMRAKNWEWYHMAGKYLAYSINPRAVVLLNSIVEQTGAKIVLSSSWRLGPPLCSLQEDFKKLNIDIFDKTPCWGEYGVTDWKKEIDENGISKIKIIPRGEIIDKYLSEHPEVENYVILDDIDEFTKEQYSHFVQIKMEHGLTKRHVTKAIKILNEVKK